MSRPTNAERGARIAIEIATLRALQADLFNDQPDVEFWRDIESCARLELAAAEHLRALLKSAQA